MAELERIAEELNAPERRRELEAQDLCDFIRQAWRDVGSHNVPVEIPGHYSLEAIVRARELFLQLPENLNMGDPKVDFYMVMGRHNGNPYIILCTPGTVI